MCRTLACCRPSTNNNVAPDAIPEQSVVRVQVAAVPAPKSHRYTSSLVDIREALRTTPAVEEVGTTPPMR